MGNSCSVTSCMDLNDPGKDVDYIRDHGGKNYNSANNSTIMSMNTTIGENGFMRNGRRISVHPKLVPLINNLIEAFKESSNQNSEVSRSYLVELWRLSVEDVSGDIGEDDGLLIQESVNHFADLMDLDNNGMISYAEFMTYMLGGLSNRGNFGSLRDKLSAALEKDPQVLQKIYQKFQQVDKDGNGVIEKDEIVLLCKSMASELETDIGNPADIAEQYMDEMDLDGDGKVDYYEFLSYQLGRRKRPVELIVYDISNGMSNNFSLFLMGKQFEAIYHTGVVCFGMEYWYGGNLFQNEPPMDKYFGAPLSESNVGLQDSEYPSLRRKGIKVLRLGYTLYTKNEALRFLNQQLSKKYRGDNYDVLKNNCNTFSDEFIHFLTGNHIPAAIRDLPEIAMQTRTAKILRPVLNMYLGGFGSNNEGGDGINNIQDGNNADEAELEDLYIDDGFDGIGQVEIIPKDIDPDSANANIVLARVIKMHPDKINKKIVGALDVRWFEPGNGKMVTMEKVPIKTITEALFNAGVPRNSNILRASIQQRASARVSVRNSNCLMNPNDEPVERPSSKLLPNPLYAPRPSQVLAEKRKSGIKRNRTVEELNPKGSRSATLTSARRQKMKQKENELEKSSPSPRSKRNSAPHGGDLGFQTKSAQDEPASSTSPSFRTSNN